MGSRENLTSSARSLDAAFRRIPITTIRLELEGDVRESNLTIVAVPSYRRIAAFGSDLAGAAEVLDGLAERLAAQRRSITRPDGTCPRCAGPLQRRPTYTDDEEGTFLGYEFWCSSCEEAAVPAGARISDSERVGNDDYRAAARRRIESSRA